MTFHVQMIFRYSSWWKQYSIIVHFKNFRRKWTFTFDWVRTICCAPILTNQIQSVIFSSSVSFWTFSALKSNKYQMRIVSVKQLNVQRVDYFNISCINGVSLQDRFSLSKLYYWKIRFIYRFLVIWSVV